MVNDECEDADAVLTTSLTEEAAEAAVGVTDEPLLGVKFSLSTLPVEEKTSSTPDLSARIRVGEHFRRISLSFGVGVFPSTKVSKAEMKISLSSPDRSASYRDSEIDALSSEETSKVSSSVAPDMQ